MAIRQWGMPAIISLGIFILAGTPDGFGQPGGKEGSEKKEGGFPGGFPGGPGMKGGFGPPGGQERKLLKEFDKNKDGWLNAQERSAARATAKTGGGGFRPKGGFGKGGNQEPPKPGPKVNVADAKPYPDAKLYDTSILRTIFLEFENNDWETELEDFHGTDIDVPAKMIVDGKTYPNVGVHFRGMSSYGMVSSGRKRSLNIAMDLADEKQKLLGYKTLNLLNSHEDPTFMSSVLYSHIAGQYIPVPKANFVKVVINGESWGVYANVQQFNKDFTKEFFNSTKGARWKVRGSPGGGGGLEYTGDNIADYKRRFEIKSKDDDKDWKALINLCKVLAETPADKLEDALKPIMDIDSLLWFLALDVALINSDGYWVRASDYSIYLDEKKKFHILPHDMNEAFHPPMGPGMGGPGGRPGGGRPGGQMRLPAPGEILPMPLRDMLQLTDAQRKAIDQLQQETDAQLEKLLTDAQRKQLKQMKDMMNGGPGGFPGGPPGGFPGGPGEPPGGRSGPPGGGPGGPGMPPGGFPSGPPGGGMGGGGSGVSLDPLINITDARKPLRSKVLAVPSLRKKYLDNVRTIATKSLDWKTLGPVVAQFRELIAAEVKADTRKLETFEAFELMTADAPATNARGREFPLRTFADQRRQFLLNYKEPTPK